MTALAFTLSETAELSGTSFSWQGHDVEISVPLARLESEWRELEAHDSASAFQAWRYIDCWCRDAATRAGERPLIVTVRKRGALQLVLPLALVQHCGVPVLTWLGQSHSNYGMALARPDVLATLSPAQASDLITHIARLAGAAVVHLDRQPETWAGSSNPFAHGADAVLTANDTYVLRLEPDYRAQHRRLFSSRTVSGLRRKRKKLEELGAVSFRQPAEEPEISAAIAWFIEQKRAQLQRSGRPSPFDEPGIADLYRGLAGDARHVEIDELMVGDDRLAVGITAYTHETAHFLNTACVDDERARHSPGTLLLHAMIERAHAGGARNYDFGPGRLAYKLEWEPHIIPLTATTRLVRPHGLMAYLTLIVSVWLKARVKRSTAMASLADAVQRQWANLRNCASVAR